VTLSPHRALEWLERAYQEHHPDLIEYHALPTGSSSIILAVRAEV
jgi:hypothetical protein